MREIIVPVYKFHELATHIKSVAVANTRELVQQSDELHRMIDFSLKCKLKALGYGEVNIEWTDWNGKPAFTFEKDLTESEVINVCNRILPERMYHFLDKLSKYVEISIRNYRGVQSPMFVNVEFDEPGLGRSRTTISKLMQGIETLIQSEIDRLCTRELITIAQTIVNRETNQDNLSKKMLNMEYFRNGFPFAGKIPHDLLNPAG